MKRNRFLFIAMTALTLLLCAALCASALTLYRSGLARRAAFGSLTEPIFTREAVARQLLRIRPLAGLWGIAAIAGLILRPARLSPLQSRPECPSRPLCGPAASPRRNVLRALLGAAALCFIVLGVLNGGLRDVFVKAINICTECIGLG